MGQSGDRASGLDAVETQHVEGRPLGAPTTDSDNHVLVALAAAHMGVFELHVETDVLTWTSTTGLGLTPAEAPTTGRAFFEFVHPDDRQALAEARDHAIRTETDFIAEFRIVTPNGAVHWIQAQGRFVYDSDKRPVRILGVNNDITERKLLEEQLALARIEVARLNVLKATMRTVQDIVSNALMSLQLFRPDTVPHVSAQSLELFDQIIAETAEKLKAIGDLKQVIETKMVTGPGIKYRSGAPANEP
jgi:PAS domain S-box-containing protein